MGPLERHYPDEGSVCQEQHSPELTTKWIFGDCLKPLKAKNLIPQQQKYGEFIHYYCMVNDD